MGHPAISVILPFFNADQTLERAIGSILSQTFEDFELLLVDDGSTDASAAIAGKFLHDRRVRLIRINHKGVVDASSAGLDQSYAPFIARMDADDVSHPARLEHQKEYLEKHPHVGVVGSMVRYVGPAENAGFRAFVQWNNSVISLQDIYWQQFVEMPIVNPSLMYRRSVIQALGWYKNGDFPEDYELVLRYLEADIRFEKVPETLLDWYDTPTRLTRTDAKYSTKSFFQIKSQYLARWLVKNNPYHPCVWIWGGGKLSRKRSDLLIDLGIEVRGYIDVKVRTLDRPCVRFDQLPDSPDRFILSYVGNRGKREEISMFLRQRGYKEGRDFLSAS
ncbi:MAG: glycosyltransferase family 2 protein [Bacteroidota bacterium]